jgi:hypothetical protein
MSHIRNINISNLYIYIYIYIYRKENVMAKKQNGIWPWHIGA